MNENRNNGLRPIDYNGYVAGAYPAEPTNRDLLNQLNEIHDKILHQLDDSNARAVRIEAALDAHIAKSDRDTAALMATLAEIHAATVPQEASGE